MRIETALAARGSRIIAGIDEAGRGPLAGPVVAAAVILDRECIPAGLNDSKQIEPQCRCELFDLLAASAVIAWCAVDAATIDRVNIRQATLLAMQHAAAALPVTPDAVLVDGRDLPLPLRDRGHPVVGGDAISQSIAAASIVAKVVRDRIMERAEMDYPGYGFASHKGYCTALHLEALGRLGPCRLHRRSYAPVHRRLNEVETAEETFAELFSPER